MSNLIEMGKFIHSPRNIEKRLERIENRLIQIEDFLNINVKVEMFADGEKLLELIREPAEI